MWRRQRVLKFDIPEKIRPQISWVQWWRLPLSVLTMTVWEDFEVNWVDAVEGYGCVHCWARSSKVRMNTSREATYRVNRRSRKSIWGLNDERGVGALDTDVVANSVRDTIWTELIELVFFWNKRKTICIFMESDDRNSLFDDSIGFFVEISSIVFDDSFCRSRSTTASFQLR